jgi:hypothetical protein
MLISFLLILSKEQRTTKRIKNKMVFFMLFIIFPTSFQIYSFTNFFTAFPSSVVSVIVKFHHVVNGITPPSFAKGA